jgi:hypothetical protein
MPWCLIISIHIIASSQPLAVFRRRPGAVPLLAVAYPRGVDAKLPEPLELVPGETPRGQGRPPLKFMRWKEPGQYYLPRAAIEPPEVLQR